MALYDQIFMFVDGGLAAENTTVDTEISSDVQQVMTIAKGFAGITPSPHVRTITAESVVPVAGFEFDYESAFLNSQEVEIVLQQGGSGKKTTSRGYFTNVSVSAGVGRTATVSFQFVGTAQAFA
jgi:hypothetical protein